MTETTPDRGLLTEAGHFSELAVNRHLQGELVGAEKTFFDDHLGGCEVCHQFVERIETFDQQWRSRHSWPVDGPRSTPSPPPSPDRPHTEPPRRALPRWLAPSAGLVAMIAAVALVIWVWDDAAPTVATLEGGGEGVHIKGGGFGLAIYADRARGSTRLSEGQIVYPGDRLGFRVHSDDGGHLMIAGIDDMGHAYLCHPQPPLGTSVLLPPSPEGRTLDAAIELDDLLGREHIIAVMCPEPFTFSELQAQLRVHGAQKTLPALLEGCTQREISLIKTADPGPP